MDLPDHAERQQIWQIHLQKRGRDPKHFDLPALAAATDKLTGAEIEQTLTEALHTAFSEDQDLQQPHLKAAANVLIPLATTMSDQISQLRDWSQHRTRPASPRDEQPALNSRKLLA